MPETQLNTPNTLSVNSSEYVWVEKYRPKNVEDIILDDNTKMLVKKWIEDKEIANVLFSSTSAGTGKSSLAHVLINEIGAEALFINASLENSIDMLRTKIQNFSTTSSFDGHSKIVVLDEIDGVSDKIQLALRGFIESFSMNVRFIMTANNASKLIAPLRDRLIEINFDKMFHDNKVLVKDIALRSIAILENEGVKYNKEDVIFLVKHFYPSSRSVVKKLQQFSTSGELVVKQDEVDTDTLIINIINAVKNKDFPQMRKDINKLHDPTVIFTEIYNNLDTFDVSKRPPIVICVAKYQANDALVRDKIVNVAAMLTEIMGII